MSVSTVVDAGTNSNSSNGGPRSQASNNRRARFLTGLPSKVWWVGIVLLLGFLLLYPLVLLEQHAFAHGAEGLREAFALKNFRSIMYTTALLGVGSTFVAVVLGVSLAVATTRLPRSLRWLAVVPIVPLAIPAVAAVIGWMFLFAPTVGYVNTALRKTFLFDHMTTGPIDVYSRSWIVFITGFSLTCFVFLFTSSSLRAMGSNYQVAAASCGASQMRILWTITIPLLRPAITYSAGIVMLLSLGQFTAPLILGRQQGVEVVSTAVQQTTAAFPIQYGVGAGLGAPLIVVCVVIVLLQRLSLRDSRKYVVASGRIEGLRERPSYVAVAGILLYGCFAMLLPLAALTYVSLTPYWSGSLTFDNLTLANWDNALGDGSLWSAASMSVRTAALATIVVLPLGLAAAWALSGYSRIGNRLQASLDLVSMGSLAVPTALLGFGFLFAYSREPLVLYGTPWLLIIVYITIAVPHATRMQLTSLTSLGVSSYEASRVCGAGLIRTFIKIVLPLIRNGVASAAALIFVVLSHEFTASLMVRSANTKVLGTMLYEAFSFGLFPQVATIALVMVVVTMIGVSFAMLVGGRDAIRR